MSEAPNKRELLLPRQVQVHLFAKNAWHMKPPGSHEKTRDSKVDSLMVSACKQASLP